MKLILLLLILLQICHSFPTDNSKEDICQKLNCSADQVCDWEAVECVNKNDMTEGRPCEKHEDCRDDHICYAGRCIFFIGKHKS